MAFGNLAISPGMTINAKDSSGNVLPQVAEMLGKEEWFEDFATPSGQTPALRRNGGKRRYRLVMNDSGIALLAQLAVVYSTTAGEYGQRVDGYARTTAVKVAGIVDDRLPSAGVADGYAFLICVEGFHLCKTAIAGDATNVLSVGSRLVAETSAASTASSTAGRLALQDLTGATALLGDQLQNRVGDALTAKTTANTNADLLVYLNIR